MFFKAGYAWLATPIKRCWRSLLRDQEKVIIITWLRRQCNVNSNFVIQNSFILCTFLFLAIRIYCLYCWSIYHQDININIEITTLPIFHLLDKWIMPNHNKWPAFEFVSMIRNILDMLPYIHIAVALFT